MPDLGPAPFYQDGTGKNLPAVGIFGAVTVSGGGGGGPVTIADGADVTQGAVADAAWNGVAANATLVALQKAIAARLLATLSVSGTRANDGSGTAAGNTHLTVGGSDGTNLRPVLMDTSGRTIVVGAGATATAAVGNPVGIGAVYVASPSALTNGHRTNLITDAFSNLQVTLGGVTTISAPADASSSGTGLTTRSINMGFNGTTYDRMRALLGRPVDADPVYRPALFTQARPGDTTAYAAATATAPGDLMANSTTAGSVTPMSWVIPPLFTGDTPQGIISEFQLDLGWAFTGTVRVEFFSIAPTVTNGDNGAYAVSNTTLDSRLGYIDVAMTPNGKGGSSGITDSIRMAYGSLASNTLYALAQSITAITPTNAGTITARPTVLRTN